MLHLQELRTLSDDALSRQDVLYVNFACGTGVPGVPSIDERECEAKIKEILAAVRGWTEERLFLFETEPERFDHCWDRYRMACMVAVLQWKYNMLRDPEWTFEDGAETARNAPPNHHMFAQHLMRGGFGCCASLPVVFCSVGRRLGYPLKLVLTKHHLFVRWDDGSGKRFNVECTSHGFDTPPDEHYKTWPEISSDWEIARYGWLRSLTPREELAAFLNQRRLLFIERRCRKVFSSGPVCQHWKPIRMASIISEGGTPMVTAQRSVRRPDCAQGMNGTAPAVSVRRYTGNSPTNATDPSGLVGTQTTTPLRQLFLSPSPFPEPPKTEEITGNKYGNWKVSQENESDVLGPYESRVTIDFVPNKNVVQSTEIAFVSIIRILSVKTGKSVGPERLGKPQSLRMTEDYWFVDIKEGRKLGWYAYDNEGKPEKFTNVGLRKLDLQGVAPGSSPAPYKIAVFKDFPGDPNQTPETNVSFQFETYAIAKAGKDKGTIYGGISWGFDVVGLSKMKSHHRVFLSTPSTQFKNAVKLWDKQAAGPVAQRNDRNQVPLGPDIKFPN